MKEQKNWTEQNTYTNWQADKDLKKSFKIFVVISFGKYNTETHKMEELEERYVTDVCYSPKEFKYENGQRAYEFSSMQTAMQFCYACARNGYNASIRVVPIWINELFITNKEEQENDN